ncbi:MAG: ATP-binding cassette domain-containing protein, partial [Lactococcus raffinolactis]
MLKLETITKKFGDKVAVNQLDMIVKPGEIMGLIGQNGAGKTTTFRMILDFIKPDQGQITWQG